jgi:hypothetical protein
MWKKIEIRTGAKTAEIWKTIQDSFELAFNAAGAPEGHAVCVIDGREDPDHVSAGKGYLPKGAAE